MLKLSPVLDLGSMWVQEKVNQRKKLIKIHIFWLRQLCFKEQGTGQDISLEGAEPRSKCDLWLGLSPAWLGNYSHTRLHKLFSTLAKHLYP